MMRLSDFAPLVDGQLAGADVEFHGVSIDSRKLNAGDLFVALSGQRFDGHQFIGQAKQNGAVAALVNKLEANSIPQLKVADSLSALQQLAVSWRNRFDLPVVGITGSNGKTTVKELVGAILNHAYADVLVTQGNLNNHIGVPLTLLRMNSSHRAAVVEMGMNHAGEIAELTQMVRPSVALVNNAMHAHVENFNGLEDVARAKGEIFSGLDVSGIAVLNADDQSYPLWRAMLLGQSSIDFGVSADAAVTGEYQLTQTGSKLKVRTPKGQFDVQLGLLGKHNVMNALAAIACAVALDVDPGKIKAGIESVKPYSGRLCSLALEHNMSLIDDSYNANPGSMKAAIDVLMSLPGTKKILVAGDMGELGLSADDFHRQIGVYAKQQGVDCFLGFGELMAQAASAFGDKAQASLDFSELSERLLAELIDGAVVLVKGSRSMRMERFVKALTARFQGGIS